MCSPVPQPQSSRGSREGERGDQGGRRAREESGKGERGTKKDRGRNRQRQERRPWPRCCFSLSGDTRFVKGDWKRSQVGNTGCQGWRTFTITQPSLLWQPRVPWAQRLTLELSLQGKEAPVYVGWGGRIEVTMFAWNSESQFPEKAGPARPPAIRPHLGRPPPPTGPSMASCLIFIMASLPSDICDLLCFWSTTRMEAP